MLLPTLRWWRFSSFSSSSWFSYPQPGVAPTIALIRPDPKSFSASGNALKGFGGSQLKVLQGKRPVLLSMAGAARGLGVRVNGDKVTDQLGKGRGLARRQVSFSRRGDDRSKGVASIGDHLSSGMSNGAGLSLRGGMILSRHKRKAVVSPSNARSIAFRVRASASPSNNASMASVALLRAPLGRPEGLPDWPGLKPPCCFRTVLSVSVLSSNRVSPKRWLSNGVSIPQVVAIVKCIRLVIDGKTVTTSARLLLNICHVCQGHRRLVSRALWSPGSIT